MPSDTFIHAVSSDFPKSQVHLDETMVRAHSLDASPFEPRASMLVDVRSVEELQRLVGHARRFRAGLTFRGSCTGLCGQVVGEDVMVRFCGSQWKQIDVHEDGRTVSAWCGAIGGDINNMLEPLQRHIGPDPSSISVATIGGMAANNSTGMCCTIHENIFHTMESICFMLADGTIVDTADASSCDNFRKSHSEILDSVAAIRSTIVNTPVLFEKITQKYRIRNTSGYSLNAFTEFEDPVDIISHLMIGSEGTLGCILRVTLRTLPSEPYRATSLMLFPSLDDAAQAISQLSVNCPAKAAELLDRVSLRALEQFPDTPDIIATLDDQACAVLLETRAANESVLHENIASIRERLRDIPRITEHVFATDHAVCEQLWDMRRSMNPAFAGTRQPDEFTISEDWCVPPEKLAEASTTLQGLLESHGYRGGIHGHAFHGNLHFIVPVRLADQQSVDTFHSLTDSIVDVMVNRFQGSLKAEHGTGRSMAPYVSFEWGPELYEVMKDIKVLLDSQGVLNPGVLLNEDPASHVTGLKKPVPLHEYVDMCGECGFCEPLCPTRDVGMSPRQRIYVARTIARLRAAGESKHAAQWETSFRKHGLDICATDGLCHKRCPLGVDVASYVRLCRHQAHGRFDNAIANAVGRHFTLVSKAASLGLYVGGGFESALGAKNNAALASAVSKVTGKKVPDLVRMHLTGGAAIPTPKTKGSTRRVVYFPSCAVRTMGYGNQYDGQTGAPLRPLMEVTVELLNRAGYEVVYPEGMRALCCGKAFETKGLMEEADRKAMELNEALLRASNEGQFPVLCDTSPCFARMKKTLDPRLELHDPIAFAAQFLKDDLALKQLPKTVALHPTCSTRAMELVETFVELVSHCATGIVVPQGINCCGFAGDKGFTHPEVNAAALATLAEQVADCSEGYSTSRTCEAGLTLHAGKPYRNLLYLLEESSRIA